MDSNGANEFVDMLKSDPTVSVLVVYDEIGLGVGPKSSNVKYITTDSNTTSNTADRRSPLMCQRRRLDCCVGGGHKSWS